jgi:hypothetical protein
MSPTASCVHCLGPIRPPGLWSSSWQCDDDGDTLPFFASAVPSAGVLDRLRASAGVPIWVPQPLPTGWCVSAIGWVGDERTGARATAMACCGPAPLGGAAEAVFIAEEPGVGLAARLAGLPAAALQAGEGLGKASEAKVTAAHHPTPLWELPGATTDRVGYVGEARGVWLATAFWPSIASLLLIEHMLLVDLGDLPKGPNDYPWLVFGAPSGRLVKRGVPAGRAQAAPAGAAGAQSASDAGP